MDTEKIQAGYSFVTEAGDYHLILKVLGEVYMQEAYSGIWSTQSMNIPKQHAFVIYDGLFTNKRSLEECHKVYSSVVAPDGDNVTKLLNKVNEL